MTITFSGPHVMALLGILLGVWLTVTALFLLKWRKILEE